MPCLNEVESVGICVRKAWEGIRLSGRTGEVIVADNGSTDGSVGVAQEAGRESGPPTRTRLRQRYLAGFAAARGSIIVMGDSDDSYDFTVLPDLIAPIIEHGQDYVLGRASRQDEQGAMPWSHRWIGNPMLSDIPQHALQTAGERCPQWLSGLHSRGARAHGPAVRGHGVRLGDRGQGGWSQTQRDRGADQLPRSNRRIEAQLHQRRLAAHPLLAALVAGVPVPGAGCRAPRGRTDRLAGAVRGNGRHVAHREQGSARARRPLGPAGGRARLGGHDRHQPSSLGERTGSRPGCRRERPPRRVSWPAASWWRSGSAS